ncbi:tRNAHis guanylyltransferase [Schizopora paradoxa]|uniref:tRNA(His) guanylyltransferase n=1 Tax=Schizopora paradoxa TaxID=27342 RepID=A0A0H2S0G8_9AGAM|nr:tRNAHis guanylyltransferase [Schizopora paradoxa]
MAGTKYAYVKSFELPDTLLPGTFIVARVDGHSFHRFTEVHNFAKPNDERGLRLMDHAARDVMDEWKDIVLCFGESDEYSFLFRRKTELYNRRQAKILTSLVSKFTASYIFHWSEYFPETPLNYPPTFDARLILYPSVQEVRDYFSWRQADTHINNLYNTAFWALVEQGGQTTKKAHESLRGTNSSQKNETLFSRFGINYSKLSERFRKGSILVRAISSEKDASNSATIVPALESEGNSETSPQRKMDKLAALKSAIETLHVDIIRDEFWTDRPTLLVD